MTNRLNTRRPFFVQKFRIKSIVFQFRILFDPTIRLDQFNGIGRGHKNLGQKCIGIEGNRRQHLSKFLLTVYNIRFRTNVALNQNLLRRYGPARSKEHNKKQHVSPTENDRSLHKTSLTIPESGSEYNIFLPPIVLIH